MHSSNSNIDPNPYYISEVPGSSRETYDMFQKLSKTFVDASYDLSQCWDLQKALLITNPLFEREFKEKSKEIEEKSSYTEYWDTRFGFLATIKEKMIDKVAHDGLEVKMCPYNYLGYNVAGVHISQNADVCLTEARGKIVAGDELVLILFKYMLGKRKIVAMHDSKVLLAPTPKFDSHICEERPDPKENDSIQYIKSLVYLYEFANGNLDPVIRPRHCCPSAAMIFKYKPTYDKLDVTGAEENKFSVPYQSPLALLKPVSHHTPISFWDRQYSDYKKSANQNIDTEDSRKVIAPEINKDLYDIEKPTSVDDPWRTINYGPAYPNEGGFRDMYSSSKAVSRNGGESMILKPLERERDREKERERDRSPERNKKWNESSSHGVNKSSRGSDTPRRASFRGSKTWFK